MELLNGVFLNSFCKSVGKMLQLIELISVYARCIYGNSVCIGLTAAYTGIFNRQQTYIGVAGYPKSAFGDEAVEEVAEAVEREGAAKGIREVAARDGVLTGKEVSKGGIEVLLIDVGPHGQRVLIDFEATQGIQQPLIRREAYAIDMDVAAHVAAVLHLYPAAERQREGAESGQMDGRAVAHHVQQLIAHGVERSDHHTLPERTPFSVVPIHEFFYATALETRHQHFLA